VIPANETRIVIEPEIRGAQAWAERRGVACTWNPDALEMRTVLLQSGDSTKFYLRARFDNYRAFAPEWTFSDSTWSRAGELEDFPKPITNPAPPTASIFLKFGQGAVICAPFNRLAYKSALGPHQDWGGPEQWMDASKKTSGNQQVCADTVGDMLQVVYRDFLLTQGRMVWP
jgi:hypothetical protein